MRIMYQYRARINGIVTICHTFNRSEAFAHDSRAVPVYSESLPEMSAGHKAVIGALVAVATLVLLNINWIGSNV